MSVQVIYYRVDIVQFTLILTVNLVKRANAPLPTPGIDGPISIQGCSVAVRADPQQGCITVMQTQPNLQINSPRKVYVNCIHSVPRSKPSKDSSPLNARQAV